MAEDSCIEKNSYIRQFFQVTKEGELLPFYQEELQVGGDGEEDRIFFIWPTTIVHKIVPESPLYRLSAADMLRERFEVVVILEGNVQYFKNLLLRVIQEVARSVQEYINRPN